MPSDEQYQELQRQVGALTERIHKLELRAGLHKSAPPSVRQRVQRNEADLEAKIGGHWLNRVGIVAVLIGFSYFLKYAFENDWVGPAGRVVIGLAAGLGIVFWSEHVRRSGYAIFSHSLKAIGIGVLYLSLWASSQVYQLVPNSMAFFAMTWVTAATIGLALWQDAEIIAAFAALGAFITPVALSNGENHAVSLFAYLTILDIGALVLLRYRSWIRILAGSFIGTLVLYSTWHSNFYTPDQFSVGIVSITAIFLAFALSPFVDKRERDTDVLLVIAVTNAAAYFFQVWELFEHESHTRESALAAAGLGVLYLAASYVLAKSSPRVVAQVHTAIAAAFFVIAVPIGLEAQWITLGWLVESAALVEVSRRTGNETLKVLGGIALALGVARVLFIDQFDPSHLVLNERMMISAIAVAVLAFIAQRWPSSAPILIVTLNLVALISLNREVTSAFTGILRDFAYSALWMAYGACLMFVGFWKSSGFLRWQALILIFITICKVFLYDTSSLDRGYRILSLIALGFVLLITSFLYQRDWFKLEEPTR